MAHPLLAIRDPLYWSALVILAGAVVTFLWALKPSPPSWVKPTALVTMLVLALPSGCYAMLGTACYVGGDCP